MRIDATKIFSLVLLAAAAASASEARAQDWNEIPLPEHTFWELDGDFRSDVIDIPLGPGGELEYKLAIEEGAAVVYEWDVLDIEDPELLYSEFHGHTERVGSEPGDLMFYRKASGGSERGMLIAPFTGIHGWYLVNGSDTPIVVRLEVAGFYSLVDE